MALHRDKLGFGCYRVMCGLCCGVRVQGLLLLHANNSVYEHYNSVSLCLSS
jgi:hypothetical protein